MEVPELDGIQREEPQLDGSPQHEEPELDGSPSEVLERDEMVKKLQWWEEPNGSPPNELELTMGRLLFGEVPELDGR